jgi:hypothetical protein
MVRLFDGKSVVTDPVHHFIDVQALFEVCPRESFFHLPSKLKVHVLFAEQLSIVDCHGVASTAKVGLVESIAELAYLHVRIPSFPAIFEYTLD